MKHDIQWEVVDVADRVDSYTAEVHVIGYLGDVKLSAIGTTVHGNLEDVDEDSIEVEHEN